jgi:hypothetical protein
MPTPLPVLTPPPAARAAGGRVRRVLLRLYRLAVLCTIVYLIHRHHVRLRIDTDAPVRPEELRPFFPDVVKLDPDPSERAGHHVLGPGGKPLGYALRTSPVADAIKGYAGPTDTLVVLDADMKVVGVAVRSSWDTKEHVRDVVANEYFMATWNGKTWQDVAGLDPRAAGIEGVSGASLTSLAIANAIQHRFKHSLDAASTKLPPPRLAPHDYGLLATLTVALAFTFSHRLRSHTHARRAFQIALIGYLGLWNGQILAQSLAAGWASTGVAWRTAPALALLMAAALLIPWSSRRQIYCSHLCPHGAAQEFVGRLRKRKLHLPKGLEAGLRWLPPLLIAFVLTVVFWNLPFDLAAIEPFDAYSVWRAGLTTLQLAGIATIAIALAGLVAAAFVPMAYCKYGCPTGLVLSFVRSHGRADAFSRRDLAAAAMLLFAVGLYLGYDPVQQWILRR